MSEDKLNKFVNEKVIDNPRIAEFIKNNNYQQELDFDTQLLGGIGATFGRNDYILMLQLGIPIGVVEYVDSKGNLLIDEDDEPIGDIKHIYKPINSVKEYINYLDINLYPYIIVNPCYMTKQEVRNIGYCLMLANDTRILNFETMNKLQEEILNSLPLKYNEGMKIFNKYYDEKIHRKIIYGYGVDRDNFYYLSGLDEIVPNTKKQKNVNSREERL